MGAKAWFSVGVRMAGLFALARGLYDLVYVMAFSVGQGDFSVSAKFPGFDLLLGILYSLIGLYLVRGGPMLVSYAFPKSKDEQVQELDNIETE
jgi:hypothetical protein